MNEEMFEKIKHENENRHQKYNIYKQQKFTKKEVLEKLRRLINRERKQLNLLEKAVLETLKDL